MATEIERKFLTQGEQWRDQVSDSLDFVQGYLSRGQGSAIRIRISGEEAHVNVKQEVPGTTRLEYEYEVPIEDARQMLEELALPTVIRKTRHLVPAGDLTWEIDEFHGANEGLIIAEIELPSEDYPLDLPDWIGKEVTNDIRYYNTSLSETPWTDWKDA